MTMAGATRDFLNLVRDLLKRGDVNKVKKVFSDEDNTHQIVNGSWDLVPIVTEYLTEDYEKNNGALFQCCVYLLDVIAETSNPEETVLQFIEEIEECRDDTKFLHLLNPVQKLFCRICQRKSNALAWFYNAIQRYIDKCEPPECDGLVSKQKLLLDSDERTQRILFLYSELLTFYNKFFRDVTPSNIDAREYIYFTRKFLVRLLGKPLICLDMEVIDGVKGKARLIVEDIVNSILKITPDPMILLMEKSVKEDDNLVALNVEAVACLFYLIYCEGILIETVPKVYHPHYFVYTILHLPVNLLEHNHQLVVEKGLKFSLALVKNQRLPYLLLDSEYPSKFCVALSNIIIYHQLEPLRKKALDIYKDYIIAFDTHGIYLLIYNLMNVLNNPGLIGFTITLYKDLLALQFRQDKTKVSTYFKGKNLLTLLRRFCYLHKKEESDLIEILNQITATLNFLRFLALSDTDNVTGIWNYIDELDREFLKPLRKGIDLSKAHYDLRIKEIKEGRAADDLKKKSKLNIKVGGTALTAMSKSEQLEVLQMSVTALDVIDSLLSRVNECIEARSRT